MRRKKIEKKLGLKKITIANLSDQEMRVVQGGIETEGSWFICSERKEEKYKNPV